MIFPLETKITYVPSNEGQLYAEGTGARGVRTSPGKLSPYRPLGSSVHSETLWVVQRPCPSASPGWNHSLALG